MDKDQILKKARDFVRDELGSDSSGHDHFHAFRVADMASRIAEAESADVFVCELTGLLHDIADEKLNESEAAGQDKVRQWLLMHHVNSATIDEIMEIIDTMSFKGGGNPPVRTLEGKVVQDADRLDALGAIGIARTFAYSGSKGQLIYDPHILPRDEINKFTYRKGNNTAINHFYEKLLKLKSMMNTNFAKEMAEERHQFMMRYLDQFYKEWNTK